MSGQQTIAFWVAAGPIIGFGHLRRCLTLAAILNEHGVRTYFLLDAAPDAVALANAEGQPAQSVAAGEPPVHQLTKLPERIAAIVVDSYVFKPQCFARLRACVPLIIAIDDNADRELDADLIVNGSAGADALNYPLQTGATHLLGTDYMLLRPEFAAVPARDIHTDIQRVLVTVGGSDPRNLTSQLVQWTLEALPGVFVDAILGPLFEPRGGSQWVNHSADAVTLHQNTRLMRDLMLSADLAITAGGQTTYELAACGTPSLGIRVADNQTINLSGLSKAGTLLWVGDADDDHLGPTLKGALVHLGASRDERAHMSARGRRLVDGRGAARAASAILERVKAAA